MTIETETTTDIVVEDVRHDSGDVPYWTVHTGQPMKVGVVLTEDVDEGLYVFLCTAADMRVPVAQIHFWIDVGPGVDAVAEFQDVISDVWDRVVVDNDQVVVRLNANRDPY